MKKLILTLCGILVALTSNAEFRWGPTAGLNISTIKWSQNLVNTRHTPGYSAGIFSEIMIPGIGFGLDGAIKYANHGAKINFGDQYVWSNEGYGDVNYRMHSIQIPLNLRFKYTRLNGAERTAAPFVYAGPVLSFNFGSSELPIVDRNSTSLGLQCGIGGEFFERYQLSAGYMWGTTTEIQTKKLNAFEGKDRGWQLNFAVLF